MPKSNLLWQSLVCSLVFFVATPLWASAQTSTPNHWGNDTFDAESPRYQQEVRKREQAFRQISSRIDARRKEIDSYLGSFLVPGRAAEVEAAYERGPYDAYERRDMFETATRSAQSAERVYLRHRALVDAGRENERNASTRGPLWYEHLYWLDLRNQAAEREYQMLDSRLIGLRAAAGFDWTEFWADNADDLAFVFRDVAANFAKEVSTCFSDLFRKSLTGAFTKTVGQAPTAVFAPSGPSAPLTLGSLVDVAGCVTGPAMNTWVNALAAALKKQFLDEMRREGVIEVVALYWWDTLIAADETVQKGFVESAHAEMFGADGMLNILKTHTEETAARVLATSERPAIERELAGLVQSNKLNQAGAKTTALQIAERRGKARVENLVKGLQLGVNLTAKAGLLLANSGTYDSIRTNELGKYRGVVACLQKTNRPVDGTNVLPYIRVDASASSYVAFLQTCRADPEPEPPPVPAVLTPADADAVLDRIRGQASAAGRAANDALESCGRTKGGLARLSASWDRAAAALVTLRAASGDSTPADLAASADQAESLAREAYAAGEAVSAARTQSLRDADAACRAADALASASGPARAQERTTARTSASAATRNAADATSALARARAALAKLEALRAAAFSTADQGSGLRSAETRARQALEEAQTLQTTLEAEVAAAEGNAQRAQTLVDALHGAIAQAQGAGYDAATMGRLAAESDRADRALQAALACPAELRQRLQDTKARGAALEADFQPLFADAGRLAGAAGPSPEAQRIANALADAQASFDAADLFADSAQSAAATAEACRARAEAIPDPLPVPLPAPGSSSDPQAGPDPRLGSDPGPPASPSSSSSASSSEEANQGGGADAPSSASSSQGGGGWTSGPARTIGSGAAPSEAEPQPGSDPRIPVLVTSIQSSANACRWNQAESLAAQLEAIDPGNAWLASNRANISNLALRQRQTSAALGQANTAMTRGDMKGVQSALGQAGSLAPSCMSASVTSVVAQAAAVADADRARRTAARRQAAGVLAQALTQLQQSLANPTSPPVATGLAGLPGLGGAAGGSAGTGGTGTPVAPDIRTVSCGATTKSGADAPATITVQVSGTGNARFRYSMFGVKDRMIVRQGGRTLVDTGCVSGSGRFDLPVSGFGALVVQVLPACETKGTQWNFTLECPK